jgi:hypothetical protein
MPARKNNKALYILGAGFSIPAGAPGQEIILKNILEFDSSTLMTDERDIYLQNQEIFKKFLISIFPGFSPETLTLEDILTPIDRAIIESRALRKYIFTDLIEIRQVINSIIILFFKHKLKKLTNVQYLENFADYLINSEEKIKDSNAVITLNWDIILDDVLQRKFKNKKFAIDYMMQVTNYYPQKPIMPALVAHQKGYKTIKLLKMHGSMNWLLCPSCGRLYSAFNEKISSFEFISKPTCRLCIRNYIQDSYFLKSQLLLPTFLKDLSNAQYKLLWQNAGIELSEAAKIIFIGYSFPQADFEFRNLLARAVRHDAAIEIVLHKNDKFSKKYYNFSPEYRFKSFFPGHPLTISYDGVETYVDSLSS